YMERVSRLTGVASNGHSASTKGYPALSSLFIRHEMFSFKRFSSLAIATVILLAMVVFSAELKVSAKSPYAPYGSDISRPRPRVQNGSPVFFNPTSYPTGG